MMSTFIVAISFLSLLVVNWQQTKLSHEVTVNTLLPLQTQLAEQKHLIYANQLIHEMLALNKIKDIASFHSKLTLQSRLLSLLKSQHKDTYQQWFESNLSAEKSLKAIIAIDKINLLTKEQALIRLDRLIIASKIAQFMQTTPLTQKQLITKVVKQLHELTELIAGIGLSMRLIDYQQHHNAIRTLLINSDVNTLAIEVDVNPNVERIIQHFKVLKDDILRKEGLVNFQNNVLSMDKYQRQLVTQQRHQQAILARLLTPSEQLDSALPVINAEVQNDVSKMFLPTWLITMLFISFVILCFLLRMFTKRYHVIKMAIKNHHLELTRLGQYYSNKDANQEKIKTHSEPVTKRVVGYESKSVSVIEQAHHKQNYCHTIRQLILLGHAALTTAKITTVFEQYESTLEHDPTVNNERKLQTETWLALHTVHRETLMLASSLRQVSRYWCWPLTGKQYTENNCDLSAELQGLSLSFLPRLYRLSNTLRLSVGERVHNAIIIDIELFADMFTNFVDLMLLQQTAVHLDIEVMLINEPWQNKQQVRFFARVHQQNKSKELARYPNYFKQVGDEIQPTDYFKALLTYLDGENLKFEKNERSFQSSFTLPLSVMNTVKKKTYSDLLLPAELDSNRFASSTPSHLPMPIEVLIAVRQPELWVDVSQILHMLGLSVHVIASEFMLNQCWKTGRYAVLLSEFDYQPFITFIADGQPVFEGFNDFPKGVFSLNKQSKITPPTNNAVNWVVGTLYDHSSFSDLEATLSPWLNRQVLKTAVAVVNPNKHSQVDYTSQLMSEIERDTLSTFEIESFINNQGSVELAFFMLDQYINDNKHFVSSLNKAIQKNDKNLIKQNILYLLRNAKILAASRLTKLCQAWQCEELNQTFLLKQSNQKQLLVLINEAVTCLEKATDIVD